MLLFEPQASKLVDISIRLSDEISAGKCILKAWNVNIQNCKLSTGAFWKSGNNGLFVIVTEYDYQLVFCESDHMSRLARIGGFYDQVRC